MANRTIHPSAIVDPAAELGDGVEIGPFCIISGAVKLGARVRLISHVTIHGPATIGEGTTLYPGVCIGMLPQDYKFKPGMATAGVVIGNDCLIREHVTIHAASKEPGQGPPTTLGDRVFMMVNSHAGHDTKIGNDVILVNGVLLAGHTEIGDKATLSGAVAVHQFARVGRLAFASGLSAVARDLPPFCIAAERNQMKGINAVGLRRSGMPREHITALRAAFREAFRVSRTRPEQIEVLRALGRDCPPVMEMADFVAASKRGLLACAAAAADDESLE
jgi:UDP-N-acetylglucosamine acyltransferase